MADLNILLRARDATRAAFQSAQGSTMGLANQTSRLTRLANAAAFAIAGIATAAIAGLSRAIAGQVQLAESVDKMSIRVGVATETLSQMGFVLEQGGTNLATYEKGLFRLQDSIQDARDGLETYARSFRTIGVNLKELEGLNADEQFLVVADALNELDDAGTRAALSQDIFGRAGRQLLPTVELGARGIREMRKEADRLGRTIGGETAEEAAELVDTVNEIKSSMSGVTAEITAELLPALNDLARGMATAVEVLKDAREALDSLQAAEAAVEEATGGTIDIFGLLKDRTLDLIPGVGAITTAYNVATHAQDAFASSATELVNEVNPALDAFFQNLNAKAAESREVQATFFADETDLLNKAIAQANEAAQAVLEIEDAKNAALLGARKTLYVALSQADSDFISTALGERVEFLTFEGESAISAYRASGAGGGVGGSRGGSGTGGGGGRGTGARAAAALKRSERNLTLSKLVGPARLRAQIGFLQEDLAGYEVGSTEANNAQASLNTLNRQLYGGGPGGPRQDDETSSQGRTIADDIGGDGFDRPDFNEATDADLRALELSQLSGSARTRRRIDFARSDLRRTAIGSSENVQLQALINILEAQEARESSGEQSDIAKLGKMISDAICEPRITNNFNVAGSVVANRRNERNLLRAVAVAQARGEPTR